MIKLVGIAIVALGFALRFNTLLVVVAAGIATGLAAGMGFNEIMAEFGRYFIENRYLTLTVVLMLPVVGLLERYGLRERAEALIRRSRAATAGRVLVVYTAVRQVSIALGINIGGQAAMTRPLVSPMAEGAAHARAGALPPKTTETIRAHAAAAENVGNFFGEDTVFAVGAVLLIQGTLHAEGHDVSLWLLSWWGIPTAFAAFGLWMWRARVLDRRIRREVAANQEARP
ncbi:MAG TPA: DUF969 domain-containing protein [Lacunisphaera sp.]|nr:DUF969 domain-containing protein [Lacunisphaera sp.]